MERLTSRYYKNDVENPLFLQHSSKILYKKLNGRVKLKNIKNFLEQQRNYTLFKQPSGKNSERNPYRVYFIDQCWEMDLMSLPALAKYNSGFVHILVCIDLFSRFAFARCLRTKKPREVIGNLIDIFKSHNRKPFTLVSDKGGEFVNKNVKDFLQKEKIKFRTPVTTLKAKCSLVERLNRSLRQRLSRFFNYKKLIGKSNANRYYDSIQLIVDDYNRTRHSTLGIAPVNVTAKNSTQVYHRLKLQREKIPSKAAIFMVNEFVRVKRRRETFEKATFQPQWTNEIFRIYRVIMRRPYPVYEICDLNGKLVNGKFYARELQRIQLPNDTPIEILQRPNIFETTKKVKTKTKTGGIRFINSEEEKQKRKENNYADVISKLFFRSK